MKLCTAVQEGCGYKDTLRASLLCSVGKIFHCVHYLSAAPRIRGAADKYSVNVKTHKVYNATLFTLQAWKNLMVL